MTASSGIRMARLVRLDEMDRTFDLEFWSRMGAEERFRAAWEMVLEVNAIKGKDIDESRLQRSVQNIKEHGVKYVVVGAYAVTYHARALN